MPSSNTRSKFVRRRARVPALTSQPCKHCHKTFGTYTNLKNHLKKYHRESQSNIDATREDNAHSNNSESDAEDDSISEDYTDFAGTTA